MQLIRYSCSFAITRRLRNRNRKIERKKSSIENLKKETDYWSNKKLKKSADFIGKGLKKKKTVVKKVAKTIVQLKLAILKVAERKGLMKPNQMKKKNKFY